MKTAYTLTVAALLGIATALFAPSTDARAWGAAENSDVKMMRQLDTLVAQSNKVVGMPSIVNFFEKQMVRQLYEMRDDPTYRTYSYVMNMQGEFIKICDSIGYGINASIQFSNPVKPGDITETVHRDYAGVSLDLFPQAEPNGLFMPEGLAATYIVCLDPTSTPDNPKLAPVYLEPDAIVSPFPLGGQ